MDLQPQKSGCVIYSLDKKGKTMIKILVFLFVLMSFVCFISDKNSAINATKEICINSRYYPKHYCHTPSWIKKFFKVKQNSIPKFICFEFYLAVFYVIMGLVDIIILLFLYWKCYYKMIYVLYAIYWCIIGIDQTHFIILVLIYKYNKKEKNHKEKKKN